MKQTKPILILLPLFFLYNCGDKVREEITERFNDGRKKTILKIVGEGSKEVTVEKIGYSQRGDTILWENYDFEGTKDGYWIGYRFDNDGNRIGEDLIEKGQYKIGKKEGVWKTYENGYLSSETNFKNGKEDGEYILYNQMGLITLRQNYKDGKEDGESIWFYENGQIESEYTYKDGKLDGKHTEYYENGQIKSENYRKDGSLNGEWIYYNKDGSIDKVENYKDDKLDGKMTIYSKNGQIWREKNYKDGIEIK